MTNRKTPQGIVLAASNRNATTSHNRLCSERRSACYYCGCVPFDRGHLQLTNILRGVKKLFRSVCPVTVTAGQQGRVVRAYKSKLRGATEQLCSDMRELDQQYTVNEK